MNSSILILLISFSIVLGGCVRHNTPQTENPNKVLSETRAEAFVDQNGTFYPLNWKEKYGPPAGRGAYSLTTLARWNGSLQELRTSERRTLDAFKDFVKGRERLFILVHGYNNDQREAKDAYDEINKKIALKPTDGILEFYWDGLVAGTKIGSGKIWFNAVGYSQLAGTKGLRRILNLAGGKRIVFISHSRGASVVLSALGNPPYGQRFAEKTLSEHGVDVFNNPPINNGGNRISAVLLAPAIGLVDLGKTNYYSGDISQRLLDPQVEWIQISVNANDPVLLKIKWKDKFNPTDIGCDQAVAQKVKDGYKRVGITDFSGMKKHAFGEYVRNPKFLEMLNAIDVETVVSR